MDATQKLPFVGAQKLKQAHDKAARHTMNRPPLDSKSVSRAASQAAEGMLRRALNEKKIAKELAKAIVKVAKQFEAGNFKAAEDDTRVRLRDEAERYTRLRNLRRAKRLKRDKVRGTVTRALP